jgi:hypothetical protein
MNQVEISPEVVKLARSRSRSYGVSVTNELARSVVEETVLNLINSSDDGFLIDEETAYSSSDSLVAAFGVNDVVVNNCRLDVRAIDEEGRVGIDRALITTSYLAQGTLVVQSQGFEGTVVGYIPADTWQTIDENAGNQQVVHVRAKVEPDFDLSKLLISLKGKTKAPSQGKAPDGMELTTFVANRGKLILARQRQIVEATLANPQSWTQLEQVIKLWSKASVSKILNASQIWNQRVERISGVLKAKFAKLSHDDVRKAVERLGEKFGGQIESAEFRKSLLTTLTQEELGKSLAGAALKKANSIAEAVLSGRAVNEAVQDLTKNKIAVDLANQIKQQRRKVAGFMDASADELSQAFQKLALQPVYSTHSQDSQAGVEAINEALTMLTAADLAQQLKDAEAELINA